MTYRLIQYVDGQWIRTEFTDANLIPAMEVRGFTHMGLTGGAPLRPELRCIDRFAGVHGPSWDGDAIRYEDPAAYKALSA
jgi:hypothetical protein